MQDMIKFSRAKELEEQKQATAYAVLDSQSNYSSSSYASRSNVSMLPAPRRPRVHKFSSAAAFADPTDSEPEQHAAPAGQEDEDLTKLPQSLDRKFEILDKDNALRPTIIGVGTTWTKSSQKSLLAQPSTETVSGDAHRTEKNRTFDLLDALSRSGALSCDYADFHVFLAATHSFERGLMDTLIKDNVNPIEKVERSTLIVATTVHNKPAAELVKPEHLERVSTYSPALFGLPAIKH